MKAARSHIPPKRIRDWARAMMRSRAASAPAPPESQSEKAEEQDDDQGPFSEPDEIRAVAVPIDAGFHRRESRPRKRDAIRDRQDDAALIRTGGEGAERAEDRVSEEHDAEADEDIPAGVSRWPAPRGINLERCGHHFPWNKPQVLTL